MKTKPRILIGLHEIAGYNENLKKGFQELGIHCCFINQIPHPFNYSEEDSPHYLVSIQKKIVIKGLKTRSKLLRYLYFSYYYGLNLPLFVWILLNFDIVIFGYGSTFLGYVDYIILKLANKKIINIFYGSDSRPPFMDGGMLGVSSSNTIEMCNTLTRRQKKKVQLIEKYSDIILNNPASGHFFEKKFIIGQIIGIPYDLPAIHNTIERKSDENKIRILHTPSLPSAKGTEEIRKIIDTLKIRGYSIDFIEISGKSNDEVLDELRRCDFIIDQVYSDTPMAGFATEAAAFCKPSIVGGYYSYTMNKDIPKKYIPPTLFCPPQELQVAVEKMINDRNYRTTLGKSARLFVETQWSCKEVAKRYMQLINGNVPDDWYFDPTNIHYIYGWGLSEQRLKWVLKNMIQNYGLGSLRLSDKKELVKEIMQFINKD